MTNRILVVEDEAAISEMVGLALARAGYEYDIAHDAEQALALIAQQPPLLIVLDWMLPGLSGIDLARRVKREERTRAIPIIMLTARGEEADKVRGLEVGADDYLTKPFSLSELLARIKAVLRRTAPQATDDVIEVEGLRLDPVSHVVTGHGRALAMGPTEFRLLHFFMSHAGRVYSRNQLLDLVWGSNVYVGERTVDVHIRRLRKVLEQHGHDTLIQTVRGSGYRFAQPLKAVAG
ncbi:MAG: phosphate regulon transcriptional regulator PhoB [Gammaproteobacteria bacterium]|nr:phosphate regulon transcriptional regulator PhoB [Gammaproteobacteria bacterium]